VALPRQEAFGIEYWALEEAKLQRMPPEAEFSRKIVLVVGGGSGIGREVVLLLLRKGAHVVVADADADAATRVADEAAALGLAESCLSTHVDLSSSESLAKATTVAVLHFGGIDAIVNTAAIFPVAAPGEQLTEAQWARTFLVNVTGNSLLARQTEWVLTDQQLPAVLVLTSSANAVVAKRGTEAHQQGSGEPSDPGTGHQPRAAGAGERDRAGDGGGRFHHVPSRAGHSIAAEIHHPVRRI
jgi:NAD(P)-dependent dehydrogenase (short-subunit alcohol dehydrogenase family)